MRRRLDFQAPTQLAEASQPVALPNQAAGQASKLISRMLHTVVILPF